LVQCWTKLREGHVGQGTASGAPNPTAQTIYLQLVFTPGQPVFCNTQVDPPAALDGEAVAAALNNLVDGYAFTPEVTEWLGKNSAVELTLVPWH